jgi:hypothetical protein
MAAVAVVRLPVVFAKWIAVVAAVFVWMLVVPLVDAVRQLAGAVGRWLSN